VRTLVVAAGLALVSLAAAQPVRSAPELAAALQARYAAVRDFSADFVHRYRGGVLRKELTERGTVLVKKPGRMRWTYSHPEKKVFVSDGRKIYSYVPEDRQVIVAPVPEGDEAATSALFLAGKGDLTRDFTVALADAPGAPPQTWTLRCAPRRQESEYAWMLLTIDRTTLDLRSLVTVDAQGGESTFVFTNVRQNIGLTDKAFQFDIPRGVDVINQTATVR